MRQNLITAIERIKHETAYKENIEGILSTLEALINKKSEAPEGFVDESKKIWETIIEFNNSKESLIELLPGARKLENLAQLSHNFLEKYRDFLSDEDCRLLKEIYLINYTQSQLRLGLYFLYDIDKHETYMDYLLNISSGIDLIVKGVTNYPSNIDLQNHEELKALGYDVLQLSEEIKKQINQNEVQIEQTLKEDYEKIRHYIYVSAVTLIWLVEQFEKTVETKKEKNRPTIKNILKFLETSEGGWAGDDLEECLEFVNEIR
ncbi:hypothetical protein ACE1B6_08215 [Aerosakkonemataceae cyanobacterium BLCC-F154]|uniref:Uncharacterized protein n=1 Tax=Floridaenema fluviatile BLCC-F154 TaxID=3153640 RepID=A0ABV4YBH2_9CYAN